MVTPQGRVKVLDFGLAKLTHAASDETRSMELTQVGKATGTLAYMAPEQLLGEPLDARTDLYALGVVLYELVTAERPFHGSISTALANEILHGTVAPPRTHEPGLSTRTEAVILRAIARQSDRRYQTAGEMAGELRRLAAGDASDSSGVATPSAGPARRVTSIAVLPLENLSGDPSQEFFSDGMTEELISCLAQVRALRITSRHSVMRYKGQHHSIKIPLAENDDAAKLRASFDQEYERRYGHANSAAEVELVVLHSLATLHMNRPDVARLARPVSGRHTAELETRPIFFLEENRFLPTQVYDRYALKPGFNGQGPALIVEYGSSTIIGPRVMIPSGFRRRANSTMHCRVRR
jgi:serine/threonine protein kinase